MFNNIGRKMMVGAIIVCVIGIIICTIYAIVLWTKGEGLQGFLYLVGGFFISWMGSWSSYAIGQAAEDSEEALRIARENQELLKKYLQPKTTKVEEKTFINCPTCYTPNEPGRSFCCRCGAKLK